MIKLNEGHMGSIISQIKKAKAPVLETLQKNFRGEPVKHTVAGEEIFIDSWYQDKEIQEIKKNLGSIIKGMKSLGWRYHDGAFTAYIGNEARAEFKKGSAVISIYLINAPLDWQRVNLSLFHNLELFNKLMSLLKSKFKKPMEFKNDETQWVRGKVLSLRVDHVTPKTIVAIYEEIEAHNMFVTQSGVVPNDLMKVLDKKRKKSPKDKTADDFKTALFFDISHGDIFEVHLKGKRIFSDTLRGEWDFNELFDTLLGSLNVKGTFAVKNKKGTTVKAEIVLDVTKLPSEISVLHTPKSGRPKTFKAKDRDHEEVVNMIKGLLKSLKVNQKVVVKEREGIKEASQQVLPRFLDHIFTDHVVPEESLKEARFEIDNINVAEQFSIIQTAVEEIDTAMSRAFSALDGDSPDDKKFEAQFRKTDKAYEKFSKEFGKMDAS